MKVLSLEEYDKKMGEYSDRLRAASYGKEWDNLYEEVSSFQQSYMEHVLDEYQKTIDGNARQCIYNLMCHAVRISESGSSIIDVETEAEADAIDNIIWEEIGDYLLDYQIYQEDNRWVIDCIFGGNYVPYWDGWRE